MPRKNDTYILKKIYDSLCSKKSFDIMTVKEIADDVGIPRQKFYDYFSCPEEMLLYYFETEKNSIVENMSFELGTGNNISAVIKLSAQSPFMKKILQSKKYNHLVINKIDNFLYRRFFNISNREIGADNVEARYHSKAFTAMFIEYVLDNDKDPETFETFFRESVIDKLNL